MLWFALHLPHLPLEAVLASADQHSLSQDPENAPVCVVQDRAVVAMVEAAQAQGVQVGMSWAAASSLAPKLRPVPRDRQQEAALLERLALGLSSYTPSIVLGVTGVFMEVSASLRLFGGARRLGPLIQQHSRAHGVQAQLAAAPTATAAMLLAQVVAPSLKTHRATRTTHNTHPTHATTRTKPMPDGGEATRRLSQTQQRLDALPLPAVLAAWQQPSTVATLLQGIGCQTLGDVRALPRSGLKRRGGLALMDFVDRAYGQAPDPQPWYEPPPHFEMSLELLHRADNAVALVFAAQRLVQPLVGWLTQRWLAATRVSLRMKHETLHRREILDTVLRLTLGEPSRDAAQITLLLRERLQRLRLVAPVYAVTLRLDESTPHAGSASTFWRSPTSQHSSESALIDRLTARLGEPSVQRAQLHADHRPEHTVRWVSGSAPPAHCPQTTSVSAATALQAPRPTWLLRAPQALHDQDDRPLYEGAPLMVLSRAERIEAGWFDGTIASRDYHVAVSQDHRCFWIYRERLGVRASVRGGEPSARWFLHGIFS
jgi:protein ImuB